MTDKQARFSNEEYMIDPQTPSSGHPRRIQPQNRRENRHPGC